MRRALLRKCRSSAYNSWQCYCCAHSRDEETEAQRAPLFAHRQLATWCRTQTLLLGVRVSPVLLSHRAGQGRPTGSSPPLCQQLPSQTRDGDIEAGTTGLFTSYSVHSLASP